MAHHSAAKEVYQSTRRVVAWLGCVCHQRLEKSLRTRESRVRLKLRVQLKPRVPIECSTPYALRFVRHSVICVSHLGNSRGSRSWFLFGAFFISRRNPQPYYRHVRTHFSSPPPYPNLLSKSHKHTGNSRRPSTTPSKAQKARRGT